MGILIATCVMCSALVAAITFFVFGRELSTDEEFLPQATCYLASFFSLGIAVSAAIALVHLV